MKRELNELIDDMTEEQFNNWVMGWISIEFVMDIINNWEEETQDYEIGKLKMEKKND